MIETIYSNENKEANRTSRVQATFKMPKNIRQVGKSSATKKIYVEDYVMTFIKQLSGEDYSKCKIAVLVGQYVKNDNCRNIFIYGAINVEEIDTTNEIIFSNGAWTTIYEKIKKYFVEAEIVGWFFGGPGYLLEDMDKITKAHVDNFAGQDKALLIYDNMEKEESFYVYENSHLSKQEGYYIYYEKNEEMQTYMIELNNSESEEATYDDKVSREIRAVIQSKKPVSEDNKSVTRLMYAAGTLLAVIILVVGATMLSNYDQMKNMQKSLDSMSQNLSEVEMFFTQDKISPVTNEVHNEDPVVEENVKEQEGSLEVEVVPGDVTPLEEEEEKDNVSGEELIDKEPVQEEDSQPTEEVSPEEEKDTKEQNTNEQEAKEQDTEAEEVKYYTVKAGDSLVGISYKLYKSVDYMSKIMKLNNIIDEDVIYIGQRLIVP